jgi:hypothetical protein
LTDLEIARDLRAAADYLRTHRWIQGRASDDDGGACMGGAICEVVGWDCNLRPYVVALGFAKNQDAFLEWGDMGVWNDASSRTVDEVLGRLESTALGLEVRALAADKPAEELVAVGV